MSENENIENTDQQNDEQSRCPSGDCSSSAKETGKMKYAAFGFIMLLAVGVAANALIEKHKGLSASTCGTNACTTCPSQLGGLGTCGDSDNCSLAPAPQETAAGCPSQKADAGTCAMASDSASKETAASCPMQTADTSTCTMASDSAAAGCSSESAGCPSKKDCCGSEACKDKAKACGE